jgi:hypothetical protein
MQFPPLIDWHQFFSFGLPYFVITFIAVIAIFQCCSKSREKRAERREQRRAGMAALEVAGFSEEELADIATLRSKLSDMDHEGTLAHTLISEVSQ